jgi:hypothetical protein
LLIARVPFGTEDELMFSRAVFDLSFFSFHKTRPFTFPFPEYQRNQKEISASHTLGRNVRLLPGNFHYSFLPDQKGDEHGKPNQIHI